MASDLSPGDRAIVLVFRIDGDSRDYRGNDLYLGHSFVAHRPYDGSYLDDVEAELCQALAAGIAAALPDNWKSRRPTDEELINGGQGIT